MSVEASPDVGDSFRATMATVATPVCVVTTLVDGRPHGTTVSAFASLSLRPPMVLVALDGGSQLLGGLAPGQRFGVNLLTEGQASLAVAFARKGEDRFAGVGWDDVEGVPRIDGPVGWLLCEVTELVPGGDHVVVLAAVLVAEPAPAAPLTYHERAFGTHRSHAETPPAG
ncbi:MAG TPA: flavin reductase family protein [Mycobacteriales bacterium]|jgi:flavin reductase (DIM6/NTAB) family NADH-FMN oxidoreductase RutF|nr:flavin reductase family protein [Mycobacteriales bacterium]